MVDIIARETSGAGLMPLQMFETNLREQIAPAVATAGTAPPQQVLAAENVSLRLLLEQAEINAQALLAQAGIEARERDASDRLQKLILEELHHRIQNTLATVGAIASQSLRNAPSVEHAKSAIEGRLLALGRAHNLLLQARWTSAPLETVIRTATEAFENSDCPRVSIEGPIVEMTSAAVIAVAMTLNELCTNTTKFGALSVPGGHIDIHWTVDQSSQRLHLIWKERDGPPVHPPTRHSFGTRLIETLGRQLKGNVELRYGPAGFVYALDVPMASLKALPAE
jgi:two-component sensor histidine kinase